MVGTFAGQAIVWTLACWLAGCTTIGDGIESGAQDSMTKARAALLDEFAQAWNRHDLDALMSMMTADCVFEASGGVAVNGERFEGQSAVRASFAAVFEKYPDARWSGARHLVLGDRGLSEWTFTGTLADGKRVEVNGCDLFVFHGDRIAIKNSFRKNRPPF